MALRDQGFHNVLMFPSERPWRAALGAGFVTLLSVLLVAGGDDVFASAFGLSLPALITTLRVLVFVAPPLVALFTYALVRRRGQRWPATGR